MIKKCISKSWKFSDFPVRDGYKNIDIPHDYSVKKPRDPNGDMYNAFFQVTNGVYVKYLNFEKDKHYILDVDGAYMCTEVSLNGDLLFLHPNGYTPFLVDLTDSVIPEIENKLVISTNPLKYSTRWYHGCGIYRDVFMWEGGNVRIEPWDMFVSTENVSTESADVVLKFTVSSSLDRDAYAEISFSISDAEKNTVCSDKIKLIAKGNGKSEITHRINIKDPRLWDIDDPALYTLSTEIYVDSEKTDSSENTFGIRTIYADAESGLIFNGRPLKLRGGCIHHDHGVLGAAAFPAAEERKIKLLKDAGFNAVRIAHNPPSLALLEVCDRIGMIVMDEAFDIWNKRKLAVSADYHIFFREWWDRDISYMVLRDRNHPCVISYSIGNEIYEIDGTSESHKWAKKLSDEIRKYDPTRFVTSAIQKINLVDFKPEDIDPEPYVRYMEKKRGSKDQTAINDITRGFEDPLDIVGLNYHHKHLDVFHKDNPKKVVWGSENWTKNIYGDWQDVVNNKYVIGDFTWTAIDNMGEVGHGRAYYKSEEEGYNHDKYPWLTCYQGDLDLCGYRRPQSHYREAVWFGGDIPKTFVTHPKFYGEECLGTGWHWPDVHASWTFDDEYIGKPIKAETYIQADKVEWFVNGEKVGEAVPKGAMATLDTVYVKGEMTAIAYKGGTEIGRYTLKTAKKASKINVVAEKSEFSADMRDLCYFDIEIVDEDGNVDVHNKSEIAAELSGGELLGIFSADPCSADDFRSDSCHAFKGRALAIVRASAPGSVMLRVTSADLSEGFATAEAIL